MRTLYRTLALPVYVPSIVMAVGQTMSLVMLPLYAIRLGGHAAQASLVVGAAGVGSLLANVPAGVAVSRFGDRVVMMTALLLGCAAVLALVLWPGLPMLGGAGFVMGAGFGAWTLGRLSYMTEAVPAAQRGRAIALMGGTQRLGGFVGPAVGGYLAVVYGFRFAFAAALGCFLLGLALVYRYTTNHVVHRTLPERPGLASQWRVLKDYRGVFATAGVAVFAIALVRGGYALLIPLWGTHVGLDAAAIGVTFSILSAIDMLMFYPVGIVMDRYGRKWAGVPCLALLGLSLLLLPATTGFWSLGLLALLFGFGNGLGSGIVMTMGSDLAPLQRRGEFLGAWRSLADLGFTGAPVLIGALTIAISLAGASLACGAVGLAGALIMAFRVRESLVVQPSKS